MKYITAIISGLFIFVCMGLLLGTLVALVCPKAWFSIEIDFGLLSTNIPSIIVIVIASLTATHTFRASLHAKSFRFYKLKRKRKD